MGNQNWSNVQRSAQLYELEVGLEVSEFDGKIAGVHLSRKDFFKALIGSPKAVNGEMVAGDVGRRKEREALDVIPMRMAHKNMDIDRAPFEFPGECKSHFACTSATVQHQYGGANAQLYAGRVSSISG